MDKRMLRGVIPALVTPRDAQGRLDAEETANLVRWQVSQGVHGFFVAGTTGEGLLMRAKERMALLEAVLAAAEGRVPVCVQIGAIDYAETLALAAHAKAARAAALAATPPIYLRYTERELRDYFVALADGVDMPLLLYSIDLTNNPLTVPLLAALAGHPNIIGVKWSHMDYFALERIVGLNGGNFCAINGSDECLLAGLALGAQGGIGSTYNVLPGLFVRLYEAFMAGDLHAARALQRTANDVIAVLLRFNVLRSIRTVLGGMGYSVGPGLPPAQMLCVEDAAALTAALEWFDFTAQRPR